MAWYDQFAKIYDQSVERVYGPYRAQIVAAAQLPVGGTALDLPVGTGPNLPHLVDAVGATGRVVGVDLSEGMLRRGKARVERAGWSQVSLLQQDARTITRADLPEGSARDEGLDAVVVALGLTVFPEWERVFEQTFQLLKPGGRYVIFDIYAERWVPQTCMVTLMAGADMKRRVWEPLEAASTGFERQVLPGSPHVHGGTPYLATGVRPRT